MGAEESRNGNYGLVGASAVVYNMKRQVQHARPWSLLHQCSLDQWKSGHAGKGTMECLMLLLVGRLRSQQHASIPREQISSDNRTCFRIEVEVADQTCCISQ